MAEVFRAKSFGVEGFERIVAIKRILPQMAEDEEFIKMFKDEARIASQLTHQNIVQIYELGKHDDQYFISMDYVAGRDLRLMLDRFKRQRKLMPAPMACFLISKVAEALDYAHRKKSPTGKELKIIHRDVSPQNVIISYEGEVKLCDFGIAKAVTQSTRTQAGVLKGKFAYMSPEQVRGQTIDHRSDLFALGVIFFEMLTGERLFLGESDFSTLEAVRSARIPAPTRYNQDLPKKLEKIVMKMLAKDRRRRYQWASEIHGDLHEYLATSGQLFHSHHLLQFVQDAYRRDIELENQKLESFMRVKAPRRREDSGRRRYESDLADLSDPGVSPFARASSGGSLESHELRGPSIVRRSGQPGIDSHQGTHSSGTPIEDGIMAAPSVVEAHEEGTSTEDIASSVRPTLQVDHADLDAPPQVHVLEGGPTLASDDFEAAEQGQRLHAEIQAAQAELIERLDAEGGHAEGETIDDEGIDHDAPAAMPRIVSHRPASDYAIPAGEDTLAVDNDEEGDELTDESFDEPMDLEELARSASSSTMEQAPRYSEPRSTSMGGSGAHLDEPLAAVSPGTPSPVSARRIQERQRVPSRLPPRTRGSSSAPSSIPVAPPRGPSMGAPLPVGSTVEAAGAWELAAPESTDVPSHPSPPRSLADPQVLMGLAAVVGVMALVLLAVLLVSRRPKGASLSIKTEPVQSVTVTLDGKVIARSTPVDLDALPLGSHEVQLEAVGFQPYTQRFEIVEARPHTLTIPLEPAAGPSAEVAPKTGPPDAGVAPSPAPAAVATPKAKKQGPNAASAQRALPPSEPPAPKVRPSAWSVKVTSAPTSAAVTIDGRLVGTTPVTHGGLSPQHHAMVVVELDGYQPYRSRVAPPRVGFRARLEAELVRVKRVEAPPPRPPRRAPPPPPDDVEETYDDEEDEGEEEDEEDEDDYEDEDEDEDEEEEEEAPPPPPPPKPKAKPKPKPPPPAAPPPKVAQPESDEGGFLLISTSPAGVPVIIDGEETGLSTPVRRPHPLSVGDHTVSLTTPAGKTYEFRVTISPGGTTKLVKRLR